MLAETRSGHVERESAEHIAVRNVEAQLTGAIVGAAAVNDDFVDATQPPSRRLRRPELHQFVGMPLRRVGQLDEAGTVTAVEADEGRLLPAASRQRTGRRRRRPVDVRVVEHNIRTDLVRRQYHLIRILLK